MPAGVEVDAWLLHAIALSAQNRTATLRDIIATGDYINHAVFKFEEMQAGLARLIAGGHIKQVRGGFRLRPTFARVSAQLIAQHRSVRQQGQAIEVYLQTSPGCDFGESSPGQLRPCITQQDFDKVVQDYLETLSVDDMNCALHEG